MSAERHAVEKAAFRERQIVKSLKRYLQSTPAASSVNAPRER
jgi:hypothetical protein